jgi:hypothetical protein
MEEKMNQKGLGAALALGIFVCAGLVSLGVSISKAAIRIKGLDRTVVVKGLSEREAPANTAIWPITFSEADNDLSNLYTTLQHKIDLVTQFLKTNGFSDEEISVSVPSITDHQAQNYAETATIPFRYSARATITVYSTQVDLIRQTMRKVVELGKQGIAIGGQDYEAKLEFLFTKLNDLKPKMIEEATQNARQVAEKFAQDSQSKLGKIKQAQQGQFTIEDRDSNTPYIKKVRVVSTVEYYLSD